ncbi:MAG: hypothetical protein NC318_10480 [Blautia sp.]|nr:hypothetical protein [Lachnoclostridium sp.]MCM1212019.1 hypothetical protein [Blautia sp.]
MEQQKPDMITTDNKRRQKQIWLGIFLFIWCVQIAAAVFFCCKKQGFHEDEYYTYYSTARTYGLIVEDGAWMDRDAYRNEFVVLEGQGFQYGLVKLVQSWDVHPPVYYWIFHTVASFFPGQFSKWFGLGINLAAFGISLFLLRILALQVSGGDEKLSCLICFFYGFTPAALSSVVFIRMYALLTVWTLLCAILHVGMIRKDVTEALSFSRFLLPLSIVAYLGFLTHYYYFIFHFSIAVGFCVYLLWKNKKIWNCIRYGLSMLAAFLLAYLTYPSCLGQMFRGQRGAQATGNFFDVSNTLERFSFFWKLLDEYVFGGLLLALLIVVVLLFLYAVKKGTLRIRGGKALLNFLEEKREYWLLLCAVMGYFLVVSKTALLLGDTSIRYQTPIYGMAVILTFGAVRGLLGRCRGSAENVQESEHRIDDVQKKKYETETVHKRSREKRLQNLLFTVAACLCMLLNLSGLLSGRVVFLYPEDAEQIAFAKEKAAQEVPVVCLYDTGQSWCVWGCADEFFEYDRIYFAGQEQETPIQDSTIAESDSLVVYLSHTAQKEAQLQRILDSNPKVEAYELQWQDKYCDVYYFE